MLLLEALIKFSSIGTLLALLLLITRDGRKILVLRYAWLLAITMICLFLATGAPELSVSGPLLVPLRLIDMFSFVFAWWFGLALFDDEFKPGWLEWTGASIYIIAHMPGRLHLLGFNNWWSAELEVAVSGIILAMMVHLSYIAASGIQEDLIESRRRIRKRFAISVIALVVVTIILTQASIQLGTASIFAMYTVYFFTLPMSLWGVLWLARIEPEQVEYSIHEDKHPTQLNGIAPKDRKAHQRLVSIMQDEKAFAEQGLNIGKLAERVDIPPHQLRSLINQSMGYRNYTAFLNHYRINAIKQDLSDIDKSRIPLLTIALEAGFSSLAPFNRAFKKSEGMTPSDYRAKKLSKMSN